jgi:hypothetical protein
MPESPTAPSPHVQRLIDEKYNIIVDGQYIVVDEVPHVSAAGVISRAAIISPYYNRMESRRPVTIRSGSRAASRVRPPESRWPTYWL